MWSRPAWLCSSTTGHSSGPYGSESDTKVRVAHPIKCLRWTIKRLLMSLASVGTCLRCFLTLICEFQKNFTHKLSLYQAFRNLFKIGRLLLAWSRVGGYKRELAWVIQISREEGSDVTVTWCNNNGGYIYKYNFWAVFVHFWDHKAA